MKNGLIVRMFFHSDVGICYTFYIWHFNEDTNEEIINSVRRQIMLFRNNSNYAQSWKQNDL